MDDEEGEEDLVPHFFYEFPPFPSSNIWFNGLRVMSTPYQSHDGRPFACLSFRLFASEIRKGQI